MKDIEAKINDIKEGSTLTITSYRKGNIDHCNGYVYDCESVEKVSTLKVLKNYVHILDYLVNNNYFTLSKNPETGKFQSGIYHKDGVIAEVDEISYVFDGFSKLNERLEKIKKIGGNYGGK